MSAEVGRARGAGGSAAERRARMVEDQVARRGVSDRDVLAAMRAVPRHLFVDDDMAQALLALEVRRPRSEELPPVLLVADEGFSARIGDEDGETTTVLGPANDLLIWLARGITTSNVSGTADLEADISHPS